MQKSDEKMPETESARLLDLFLRSRFIYVLIFLGAFLIYNLNFREVSELDTYPTRFLPISILKEFDLDLDEFFVLHYDRKDPGDLPYYLRYDAEKGHYYSRYSLLPALFALPVYILPTYAGWLDEAEPDYAYDVSFVSKIAASLLASLSVVFFFACMKLLVRARIAIITTGVYAFGTGIWSVASQGLWQHTPAIFCLTLGLYFLLRNQKKLLHLLLASLFFSLSVASRPSNIFFLLAAGLYLFISRTSWRRILVFAILPLLIGALTIYLNLETTGSFTGGGGGIEGFPQETHGVKSLWQAPSGVAFLGLLLSPNRGLFVYAPVLVFSLLGMVSVWRKGRRWLLRCLVIALWATVVLYSAQSIWWGGWSFGPRVLTDLLPFFSLFLGVGLAELARRRTGPEDRKFTFLWGLFFVAFIYSALVQAVGFLAYPSGWNSLPQNVDLVHKRLWDFGDTQVLRCIKRGRRPSILAGKSLAHTERALDLFHQKRYDEAIAQNREAIRLYAKNPYAHNNLASVYFTLNRFDEAADQYNKALSINPNIFVAWKNLAIIHLSRGENDAARRALTNALLLQPQNSEVQRMLEELQHADDAE